MSYRTDLLAPELTVCLGTDAFVRAARRRLRTSSTRLVTERSISYRTDLLAPELTVCLGTDAFVRAAPTRSDLHGA